MKIIVSWKQRGGEGGGKVQSWKTGKKVEITYICYFHSDMNSTNSRDLSREELSVYYTMW